MLLAGPCLAGFSSDLLLFPQLETSHRSGLDGYTHIDRNDHEASANIFATGESGAFRFLGEFLMTSDEQEFERLQLGWSYKRHLFWLGLFHNPIGYWNTSYHHGAYLQTSISRPAVVEFEDKGGILPTHEAGLLAEGEFDLAGRALGYKFALASGPRFDPKLKHWDVFKPGKGLGNTSVTFNLYGDTGAAHQGRTGVFVSYQEIPAAALGYDEVRQVSSGFYGNWETFHWRWHGSAFFVQDKLERPAGWRTDAFVNAFLQAEYTPYPRCTWYGRVEKTVRDRGDAYLALFPQFVRDRLLGGLRYDFAGTSALKVELSANHVRADNYTQVMLQWSAMF